MNKIQSIAKLLAFTAVLTAPMFGQSAKQKISIDCTCTDQVGILYESALRDAIASSPRYQLALDAGDDKKGLNWSLNIVSMDLYAHPVDQGTNATVSVVLTYGTDIYVTNWVQLVTNKDFASSASIILSNSDKYITTIISKLK